ncbi:MAG: TlyA family RNA methyltransferase [Thermodesulfobacteriota bacterium]
MATRLDQRLVELGLAADLAKAGGLIGAGEVLVDGARIDKAGHAVSPGAEISLKERIPYVSRGGLKLEGGLQLFDYDPTGLICADIGASSGGFTDCLLQHGAKKVYAVDVGYGQFDWKLRQDPRVVLIERFNARNLTHREIPEPLDLAVIDASFISLTRLLPPLLPLFGRKTEIIALIKPQFELPREKIPKGGVVLDPALHQEAVDKLRSFAAEIGLETARTAESPITGPKGNREFLTLLTNSP